MLMSIPTHLRADYLRRITADLPVRYHLTYAGDPARQQALKARQPNVYTALTLQAQADAILSDYDCRGI